MGFEDDFQWQRQYLRYMKRIVADCLVHEAPEEEDMKHATDLMVLVVRSLRIGCRVRRPDCYPKYGGEFTIRASRPSGVETELSKIEDGWGDYLLYGFAHESLPRLQAWCVIDLEAFRNDNWLLHPSVIPNKDGTTFHAYKLSDCPHMVVAQSGMM